MQFNQRKGCVYLLYVNGRHSSMCLTLPLTYKNACLHQSDPYVSIYTIMIQSI